MDDWKKIRRERQRDPDQGVGERPRFETRGGPGAGFGEGGYGRYGVEAESRQLASGYHGGCNADLGDGRRLSEGAQGPLSKEELARGVGESDAPDWSPATIPHGAPAGEAGGESASDEVAGRWQREVITAGEIMTSRLRCASRDTSLLEVARIMVRENCGVVPVVGEHGRLEGLLTDRDLVLRAAAEGKPFAETHAGEIMTDEVEAVTPDEDLRSVVDLMSEKQIRRVPVVDNDDRLLGMISLGDIATRSDCDEALATALGRISAERGVWANLRG
jgi:CBS domain-containing protein